MLSPKILISGIGVVGLISTIAVINPSFLKGNSVEEVSSLVVTVANSNEKSNINLPTLLDGKNVNYLCKVGKEIIKDCRIYKLNNASQKNFDVLLENKSDIIDGAKFVVSFPKTENSKINTNTQTILVVSPSNNETKYFDLTINSEKEKTFGFKSRTIIAKIISESDSENNVINSSSFKCDLKTKENCWIYKLNNNFIENKSNLPFEINSLNVTKKVIKKSNLLKDDFVLINTTNDDIFSVQWIGKEKTIYLNNSTTEFIKVKFIASVVGNMSDVTISNPGDSEYKYLIVSASAPDAQKTNTADFYDAANSLNNYKCLVNTSENIKVEDQNCQIYKLNAKTGDSQISVDLQKIIDDESGQKMNSVPVNAKNYVLKVSKNLLDDSISSEKISLVSKKSQTEKYIDLTKIHTLMKDDVGFKTNLILAKINNKKSQHNFDGQAIDFKCKFKTTQTNADNCKVLTFSSSQTLSQSQDINIQQLSKLSSSGQADGSANNYVLIQISGDSSLKTEKELRTYVPKIFAANGTPTEALLTTEYVDSYVGTIDITTPTSSKVIKVEKSPQDYLVVVNSATSGNNPSANLFTGQTKNYRCSFTPASASAAIEDESCKLISISEPSNSRSISFTEVKAANTELTEKSNFTKDKFFKLIINDQKFMSQEFTDSTEITIKANTGSDNYGTVKVVSKILNSHNEAKTSFFLAKSKKTITASDPNPLTAKCKFDSGEALSCDMYKPASTPNASDFKEFNLTNWTKQTINKADLNENNYVIVDIKSKKDINETNGKIIDISLSSDGTNAKISSLDIIAPLYTILSSDSNSISKSAILN